MFININFKEKSSLLFHSRSHTCMSDTTKEIKKIIIQLQELVVSLEHQGSASNQDDFQEGDRVTILNAGVLNKKHEQAVVTKVKGNHVRIKTDRGWNTFRAKKNLRKV